MRRRHSLWIASWLAIGLSACTTFQSSQPSPLDTAKACAEWRWIGISLPEARCPAVPGWTAQPLFPQLAPAWRESDEYCEKKGNEKEGYCDLKRSETVPGPELIRELNRFCVYELTDAKRRASLPSPPAAGAGLVRVDKDCAALSTSSGTYPPADDWEHQFRLLLAQAGVPEKPFPITNPRGVRLAFLDTEPTRASLSEEQGNSPHGHALAHMARHIVCNGEDCAAQITTQLALPIIKFDPRNPGRNRTDRIKGGFLGMQSDLAEAIRNEVDTWRQDRQSTGSKQNLILNLSLAWDGEIFDGLDEAAVAELRAGTQAVYRALQYAAGFDALVLAAAGNQKVAPCDNSRPLLPAAWESESLRDECCDEARKAPLLYAVGGVQTDGYPIVNARRDAMPPRVAYGDRAVAACSGPRGHTAMLTGSSVATAVASSIAAVVWSSFPGLSSRDVMKILDESGEELLSLRAYAGFASRSSPAVPPNVRRLSLCTAFREACRHHSCPIEISCPEWVPQSPAALSSVQPAGWVPDSCHPWTASQPEKPPCLSCGPPGG